MSSLVVQTLGVTAPVFAMLFLGVVLKRIGWIDSAFIGSASTLVFKGSLPTLLFLSILQADLATALQPALILYFVLATIASFLLAWGWALWRCPQADCGLYVQCDFRGINCIFGLTFAGCLYGQSGLSWGRVCAGVGIVIYDALSGVVRAIYCPSGIASLRSVCLSILLTPLI